MSYHHIDDIVSAVSEGSWLCEAALWTQWAHLGDAMALKDTRICVLDSLAFQKCARRFDHGDFNIQHHASEFVKALNETVQDGPLTDVGQKPRIKRQKGF